MTGEARMSDLKVLRLLLELGSVSRAAQLLGCSQSTVSKALARLRGYFGDPLLVRAGRQMRPTPKALALVEPLAEILSASERLRSSTPRFDPAEATREFNVLVTEVGMNLLVPRLVEAVEAAGPAMRIRALSLDTRAFAARLEAGEVDLVIGSFPEASGALRRQHLYIDGYLGVARREHPRLAALSHEEGFQREQHVAVAPQGDGSAPHELVERALLSVAPLSQIRLRVPSFVAAAFVASRTELIAVLPSRLAETLAADLRLATFGPPLGLRPIRIDQLWHEHAQQDPGHRWLRGTVFGLFGKPA